MANPQWLNEFQNSECGEDLEPTNTGESYVPSLKKAGTSPATLEET